VGCSHARSIARVRYCLLVLGLSRPVTFSLFAVKPKNASMPQHPYRSRLAW
jgi:hypothetical protein